jgi:hypothetical protein
MILTSINTFSQNTWHGQTHSEQTRQVSLVSDICQYTANVVPHGLGIKIRFYNASHPSYLFVELFFRTNVEPDHLLDLSSLVAFIPATALSLLWPSWRSGYSHILWHPSQSFDAKSTRLHRLRLEYRCYSHSRIHCMEEYHCGNEGLITCIRWAQIELRQPARHIFPCM